MQALGPIPGLEADAQGRIQIGGRDVEALVAEAGGTPLLVMMVLRSRPGWQSFGLFSPPIALHYAVKAPTRHARSDAGLSTALTWLRLASWESCAPGHRSALPDRARDQELRPGSVPASPSTWKARGRGGAGIGDLRAEGLTAKLACA
jgi:hypothetical protein